MLDKLKDLDLRYEDLESQLGDPRLSSASISSNASSRAQAEVSASHSRRSYPASPLAIRWITTA